MYIYNIRIFIHITTCIELFTYWADYMIFHQLNVNKIGNFLIFQGEKLVRVYPLSHFQPIVSEIQAFASPLVCYADLYPHQCLQQNAISNPCNTCDMRFQDKNAKRLEEQKCLSSWDQQKKNNGCQSRIKVGAFFGLQIVQLGKLLLHTAAVTTTPWIPPGDQAAIWASGNTLASNSCRMHLLVRRCFTAIYLYYLHDTQSTFHTITRNQLHDIHHFNHAWSSWS